MIYLGSFLELPTRTFFATKFSTFFSTFFFFNIFKQNLILFFKISSFDESSTNIPLINYRRGKLSYIVFGWMKNIFSDKIKKMFYKISFLQIFISK